MPQNRQWILDNRPAGEAVASNFRLQTVATPDLHDGQVLMEGSPRDIVAHEGVRRVYLGERFSL